MPASEKEKRSYSHLENNLLRLSEEILQYQNLRYKDDVERKLMDLYCIKEIENPEDISFQEKSDTLRGKIALYMKKLSSLPHRSRGREQVYRGIDGKFYRSSELASWKQARKLIEELQNKIRAGDFDPSW